MKFFLYGLNADTSEALIRQELAPFFDVTGVVVDRSAEQEPIAIVEVADAYDHVWATANRLRGIFHRGKWLRFDIPAHQAHGKMFSDDADSGPSHPFGF